MKNIATKTLVHKKLALLVAGGALALSTLVVTPQPAQAAPYNGAPQYARRGHGRGRMHRSYGYTGRVIAVRSSSSFDLRVDGTTYNVYTLRPLRRALSRGDRVQVWGDRVGKNDIRNATVQIVRNR
jgi:hypothetical protein